MCLRVNGGLPPCVDDARASRREMAGGRHAPGGFGRLPEQAVEEERLLRPNMANNQGGVCGNSSVGMFWGGQMDDNSTFAESVEKPGLAWNGRCFSATVRIVRIASVVEREAFYPVKQDLQK
jgi:hypothetical protein